MAQHLKSAADADELATIAQVALNRLIPAPSAQSCEVSAHALGARQDDQVAGGNGLVGREKT